MQEEFLALLREIPVEAEIRREREEKERSSMLDRSILEIGVPKIMGITIDGEILASGIRM